MALATTTLSSAVTDTADEIVVASATSVATGRLILVDQEMMQVTQGWVSGTTIPVLRGREGTKSSAHAASANVTHGTASDFANPAPGTAITYPTVLTHEVKSYSAAGAISFGAAVVSTAILNGTSVLAMTIADPTKDQDGYELNIVANGTAAHTLTFASGLGGEGSGYDVLTANSGGPVAHKFVACNGYWLIYSQPAITGTVTNLVSGVA